MQLSFVLARETGCFDMLCSSACNDPIASKAVPFSAVTFLIELPLSLSLSVSLTATTRAAAAKTTRTTLAMRLARRAIY